MIIINSPIKPIIRRKYKALIFSYSNNFKTEGFTLNFEFVCPKCFRSDVVETDFDDPATVRFKCNFCRKSLVIDPSTC